MRSDLDTAESNAKKVLGETQTRSLGQLRAAEAIAFARACAETDPRYLDADRADFTVHPMYLPSILRGPEGGRDDEYRPDGMFADEVPGTTGLDVRLMAGGQSLDFVAVPTAGDVITVERTMATVERKGKPGAEFLLLVMSKVYSSSTSGPLAHVRETFIVR
ncbi:FAS1-like dehydratase domain-containing protein [Rhodococcoides yunnanense]|uniref:FAS1-like dehydratase domain-containing protein n=1 Tax=Rhodococcoides yunnanense TaxID=278209 RepID=UPI0009342C07|nr:MaoC family dehydratase N-terminal domain-containing protein [Rhodococcus yunnanensis]